MKDKTLVVPIDEQGVLDYENDVSKIDRLKYFILSRKEFDSMISDGFFDLLNNKFDLWIDEYEEEIIPNECLISVKQLIKSFGKIYPSFLTALNYAIECNTELCLEF
ncbi:MAG: hypothetical protein NC205_01495 [Prevotella sp.]|nr:hypothetical protein [Alistipes senegalensis]MCM1357240.1 hypothetical protein [Prevotella sp.]MCM1472844.1 hypothetical protein [Muribaculaceae bacterium]